MNSNPVFSIISPVYKADKILPKLVLEIQKAMNTIGVSYEIILIDDRSPDNSWEIMKTISNQNKEVISIRLSRNFGQHPAIIAGLSQAKGEWVVVMDCDMQDQPKEIINLFSKAMEGYDVVLARRENRKDIILKRLSSKLFSMVYGYLTETKYDNTVANFGIYNIKVIRSLLSINDYIKFFPLFITFVGYKSTTLVVEHSVREEGNTSYSFSKLSSLAFNTIISFSNKPLKLFVKFGITISIISFLFGLYNIYLALTNQIVVIGYSSLIISIWFLSGIIITIIGVVGIYIGKIFDQSKNRPNYIIDEKYSC